MKAFARFSLAAAIVGFLVSGCADTQMSKRSVIQVANRAAEASGYHLAGYKKPKVSFYSTPTNGTWSVLYEPRHQYGSKDKEGRIYGLIGFWVAVDDATGTTKIWQFR